MNGSRGPSRILAAGILLLVAGLGLLGGVVLDRAVLRHHGARSGSEWIGHPGVARPGLHGPPDRQLRSHLRERIAGRMAEDLDLSAGQREQLSVVLEGHEERLGEAMAETRPRIHQILEEAHREIGKILTPEQRERFEDMWTAHHGSHLPMLRPGRSDSLEESTH